MSNYTFNFTKDPPFNLTKKYFIEWIDFDGDNKIYVVDAKDFDSFEEARNYNNPSTGWLYKNRRFKCPIK